MTPVISMIQSAAVVILAVLFLAFIGGRFERSFWLKGLVYGIVFALTGLISMASPVALSSGLLFDARNVVMALSGVTGGPVSALITAAAVSAMRMSFGGTGTLAGVTGILLVGFFSSLAWAWLRFRGERQLTPVVILLLAIMAAALPALSLLLVWPAPPVGIYLNALTLLLPTNFVGVLLLGFLIANDQERRWAISAYSESQARLQAIANNAPVVLFQLYLTPNNLARFRYVSGGAERVLGVSAEEIVGRPGTISRMISREKLDEVTRLMRSSAAWMIELQVTRPDGEVLWMRAAAEPRIDQSGLLVWDGSLFDITEEKRTEQMKNDFISTVSHELRTPLTSIRGSLGLVSAGVAGEIPSKAAGLIRIAHSNSERLVRLINDILDIEKIESGRMPFEPKRLALQPLIQQSIDASSGYLVDRGVSVVLVDEAPGAAAIVDPDRLHQVMVNLLSNAIKYSPANDKVTVTIARSGRDIRISVADHGPGIPEAFRSRIFGKFEQADSSDSREKGGTGLGLSIVKAIAERLGGTVSFDTAAGSGTTFMLDLPEAIAQRPLPAMSVEPVAATPIAGRILICEDEKDIAEIIAAMLRQEGLASDIAPDIASAQAFLKKNVYRAMTLDMNLAGESGITLYRDLRSTAAHANLPVIVISAAIDTARKTLNGLAFEIVDWLEKPVDVTRLHRAIGKIMNATVQRRPSVLHIEDDEGVLQVMAAELGGDISMTSARTFRDARQKLEQLRYDLVILDLGLPDGAGADLMGAIPQETAIIIFSASDIDETLAQRARAAITKTRASEIAIANLVRNLTASREGGSRLPLATSNEE